MSYIFVLPERALLDPVSGWVVGRGILKLFSKLTQMERKLLGSEGMRIKDFRILKGCLVVFFFCLFFCFLDIVLSLENSLSPPSPQVDYKGIASFFFLFFNAKTF